MLSKLRSSTEEFSMARISLRPELEKFVQSKVRSGLYASEDQVVEDALLRWKADEEINPKELKRLVAQGQAEADRGDLIGADEVFAEIRHLSAKRRGSRR
jgi:putative addiction module CopG family antidote